VRVEPRHEKVEDVLVEVARQRVARLGRFPRSERDRVNRAAPGRRPVRALGEGCLQQARLDAERRRRPLERRRLVDHRTALVTALVGSGEAHVAELEQAEERAPHAGDVIGGEAERRQRRLHRGQLRGVSVGGRGGRGAALLCGGLCCGIQHRE